MTNPARALKELVSRLEEIHDDAKYMAVWTLWQAHCGPYQGPQYVDELAQAKAALASAGQECVWRQDWELSYPACTAENPESGWPNKYADCMDFCPHCGRAIQKSAKETQGAKEGGAL